MTFNVALLFKFEDKPLNQQRLQLLSLRRVLGLRWNWTPPAILISMLKGRKKNPRLRMLKSPLSLRLLWRILKCQSEKKSHREVGTVAT